MGKRLQVSSEDAEPEAAAEDRQRMKQRRLQHDEEEDDAWKDKNQPEKNGEGGVGEEESEEDVVDDEDSKAEPIGDVLKVSGNGKMKKNHYGSFEVEGNAFELEDSVLLTPEESKQKPYVAIIKDITEDVDGNLMVTGQWFYRPEEAERRGGGNWQAIDTRELFYSFHRDDVPAVSVMHKCVVHFVPLQKKLPIRSQHPGFIVQKVYDTVERKVWKLTDIDYEDGKQHEIDLLVQKTRERLGELPDLEPEESLGDQHDQSNQTAQANSKWNLMRKNVPCTDFQRADVVSTRFDSVTKAKTHGSCGDLLEYGAVLKKHNAFTTDSHCDKWLKRLLQAIQTTCKDVAAHQNAGGSIDGSSNMALGSGDTSCRDGSSLRSFFRGKKKFAPAATTPPGATRPTTTPSTTTPPSAATSSHYPGHTYYPQQSYPQQLYTPSSLTPSSLTTSIQVTPCLLLKHLLRTHIITLSMRASISTLLLSPQITLRR